MGGAASEPQGYAYDPGAFGDAARQFDGGFAAYPEQLSGGYADGWSGGVSGEDGRFQERRRDDSKKTPLPAFPLPHHGGSRHSQTSLAQTLYLAASCDGPTSSHATMRAPELAPAAGLPRMDPFYKFRKEEAMVASQRWASDPNDPFSEWRPQQAHGQHHHHHHHQQQLPPSAVGNPGVGDFIDADPSTAADGVAGNGVQRARKGNGCEVPGWLPGRGGANSTMAATQGIAGGGGTLPDTPLGGYPAVATMPPLQPYPVAASASRPGSERLLPGPPLEPDPWRHTMADPSMMPQVDPQGRSDSWADAPVPGRVGTRADGQSVVDRRPSGSHPPSARGSRPSSATSARRSKAGVCTVPLTMPGPLPSRR